MVSVRNRFEGGHGWITVDGVKHTKDIVVHVDGSITERRTELSLPYRVEYFHTPLSELELTLIEEELPELIIVGAGFKGMLLLTPKARDIVGRYEHAVLTSSQAIEMMNQEHRRFVAIVHLTC